jgi:hypothetical protein
MKSVGQKHKKRTYREESNCGEGQWQLGEGFEETVFILEALVFFYNVKLKSLLGFS